MSASPALPDHTALGYMPGMFNGKFPFPSSHMASNFSLPGIFRMGIPGKFPRFGNFPSFGNIPSCGYFGNSRLTGNFCFLSENISDFQSVFCIGKLILRNFKLVYKCFCLIILTEISFLEEGGVAK